MKLKISDSYCEWEYELSDEAKHYSIREIAVNAIRKIPGRDKITIVSSKLIEPPK
jgi:hypothetical protein